MLDAQSRYFGVFLASTLVFTACSKGDPAANPAPSASAALPSRASPAKSAMDSSMEAGGDQVKSVYPQSNDAPDPLAQRLCDALHTLPTKRKGECCKSPPSLSLASECTRMLSYALREKAVRVETGDADRCIEALEKATEGCDWVKPLALAAPDVCDGIVHGLLKEGQVCRASLECEDGLRCLGSGPTQPGRCQKPLGRGAPCSHAVDTLAAYTGQRGSDARHPECLGVCAQRFCADAVAVGGACQTNDECGAGHLCIEKKCAKRELPGVGTPCLQGQCAKGLRCEDKKCAPLGKTGEACDRDLDCWNGCNKTPDQKQGKCGMKCWASVADIAPPSK